MEHVVPDRIRTAVPRNDSNDYFYLNPWKWSLEPHTWKLEDALALLDDDERRRALLAASVAGDGDGAAGGDDAREAG